MKKIIFKIIIAVISLVAVFFLYVYFFGIYSDYKFEQEQLDAIEVDISKVGTVTKISLIDIEDKKVLKEINNSKEIRVFISKLKLIKTTTSYSCTCYGDFDINLYNADELILSISSHHAKSLAVKINNSNIELWHNNFDLTPEAKENMTHLYNQVLPNYKGYN